MAAMRMEVVALEGPKGGGRGLEGGDEVREPPVNVHAGEGSASEVCVSVCRGPAMKAILECLNERSSTRSM